jgi:hypothetical protein
VTAEHGGHKQKRCRFPCTFPDWPPNSITSAGGSWCCRYCQSCYRYSRKCCRCFQKYCQMSRSGRSWGYYCSCVFCASSRRSDSDPCCFGHSGLRWFRIEGWTSSKSFPTVIPPVNYPAMCRYWMPVQNRIQRAHSQRPMRKPSSYVNSPHVLPKWL